MISSILKLAVMILGWFGLGSKSDAQEGLDKGEKLGRAETEAAQANQELKDIQKAETARRSVTDDPKSIADDPNNAGP